MFVDDAGKAHGVSPGFNVNGILKYTAVDWSCRLFAFFRVAQMRFRNGFIVFLLIFSCSLARAQVATPGLQSRIDGAVDPFTQLMQSLSAGPGVAGSGGQFLLPPGAIIGGLKNSLELAGSLNGPAAGAAPDLQPANLPNLQQLQALTSSLQGLRSRSQDHSISATPGAGLDNQQLVARLGEVFGGAAPGAGQGAIGRFLNVQSK